jgi:putative IMPACT (imprinted ancient) family translation regulator
LSQKWLLNEVRQDLPVISNENTPKMKKEEISKSIFLNPIEEVQSPQKASPFNNSAP